MQNLTTQRNVSRKLGKGKRLECNCYLKIWIRTARTWTRGSRRRARAWWRRQRRGVLRCEPKNKAIRILPKKWIFFQGSPELVILVVDWSVFPRRSGSWFDLFSEIISKDIDQKAWPFEKLSSLMVQSAFPSKYLHGNAYKPIWLFITANRYGQTQANWYAMLSSTALLILTISLWKRSNSRQH